MEVRDATSAELPQAAEVLAQAFCTDPPLAFLVPSERGRLGLLRRYFRALLPLYPPRGVVQVTDDGSGAAAWVEPGRWPFTFREQLPAMPALLRVFGAHPVRAVRGVAAIQRGPGRPRERARPPAGAALVPRLHRRQARRAEPRRGLGAALVVPRARRPR